MAVAGPFNRVGPKGEIGPKGKDGLDGIDGKNGKNGRDGKDGITTVIYQGGFSAESANPIVPAENSEVTLIANEISISALRLVYADSPTTVKLANPSTYETANALGLTKTSAALRSEIIVTLEGIVSDPSFMFPIGALLYLGNNGSITNVPPTNDILVLIGTSLGNGKIILRIDQPIIL